MAGGVRVHLNMSARYLLGRTQRGTKILHQPGQFGGHGWIRSDEVPQSSPPLGFKIPLDLVIPSVPGL
jgi:hypothetical protein